CALPISQTHTHTPHHPCSAVPSISCPIHSLFHIQPWVIHTHSYSHFLTHHSCPAARMVCGMGKYYTKQTSPAPFFPIPHTIRAAFLHVPLGRELSCLMLCFLC